MPPSISSSGLPASAVYESMDRPSTARNESSMYFGCFDRINPSLMATFLPCFSIARFTPHSRLSFPSVLLGVFVLYVGGITSFAMTISQFDPNVSTGSKQLAIFVGIAWGTYMLGPWSTVAFDLLIWFVWTVGKAVRDEVPENDPDEFIVAMLLAGHLVIQLLLTNIMINIISKLLVRRPSSGCADCSWHCCNCCCPSCALGRAINSARQAQASSESVDEIPAFHGQ